MLQQFDQEMFSCRPILIGVVFLLLIGFFLQSGCSSDFEANGSFRWGFENEAHGKLPCNWSQSHLGDGQADWKILDTESGKILAQTTSENPNRHFNMVVCDSLIAKDMTMTVRLKSISGKHDQGGGFVWRYLDEKNHYIVRVNPLEDNVVMYKMQDGKRADLPLVDLGKTYGMKVDPLGTGWHELKLVAAGDLFTVFLDDKELYKVRDTTFTQPGKVGLWTKADAVTWFDDLVVEMN